MSATRVCLLMVLNKVMTQRAKRIFINILVTCCTKHIAIALAREKREYKYSTFSLSVE